MNDLLKNKLLGFTPDLTKITVITQALIYRTLGITLKTGKYLKQIG